MNLTIHILAVIVITDTSNVITCFDDTFGKYIHTEEPVITQNDGTKVRTITVAIDSFDVFELFILPFARDFP